MSVAQDVARRIQQSRKKLGGDEVETLPPAAPPKGIAKDIARARAAKLLERQAVRVARKARHEQAALAPLQDVFSEPGKHVDPDPEGPRAKGAKKTTTKKEE